MRCKTRKDFYDVDRTHDTVALLAHAAAAQFTASDLWPLNGSDLNPVDYKICSMTQECVYCMPILDVADLIADWSDLMQHVINEAINQWRGWLQACVRADRRHLL